MLNFDKARMRNGSLAELGCAFVQAKYVGIALLAQSRVVFDIEPCAGADLDHTWSDIG